MIVIIESPQIILADIAVSNLSKMIGTINVEAIRNFARKVEIVASQISFVEYFPSDSSDMCIPRASENASAIAIVNIPPKITIFECVPECNPTINPNVVITPEVSPKLIPIFSDLLIIVG